MRDAIQQFGDAMRAAGIDPPEKIEADGNLHRFSTNGKRNDDAGWYVLYADGIPAGHFGDFRSGLSQPWSANIGHDLSKTELAAHRERVIAIQIEKQADDELRRGEAAKKAAAIWDASEPASADHPYLVRKGVGAHGLRVSREALVVPVRDISSKLMSLQFIDMDGNKRFMKDGKIEAGLFMIGSPNDTLCIAEGVATGASIHEATGHGVAVAFNAGNLEPVARALRTKHPDLRLILCADDDRETQGNPGLTKATAAARAVDGYLAVPNFGDEQPATATDFNDLHRLHGLEAVRASIGKAQPPHRVESTTSERPRRYSEDAIADLFSAANGNDLKFVPTWGWVQWIGNQWRRVSDVVPMQFARLICRSVAKRCNRDESLSEKSRTALARTISSARTVAAVERLARGDPRHLSDVSEWDSNIWLFNAPGGTIELRSGTLRPHDRDDRITKIANATPNWDCPRWREFLDRVTAGDKDLQAYLQRLAGYGLVGDHAEECVDFFYGKGGNGKGTFLATMQHLFGEYATTAAKETFAESKGDKHPCDIAKLAGTRLVVSNEVDEGKRWDEARLKNLTGRDIMTGRFMRQDFFDFMPQFTLIIAGNHKPSLKTVDESIRRRFHLVPFNIVIPLAERDPNLKEVLRAEADGILTWAVQGCFDWQEQGLNPPEAVLDATADYLAGEDTFEMWLAECCVRGPGKQEPVARLRESHRRWKQERGEEPLGMKTFSQRLDDLGFDRGKNASGDARVFSGLRLNEHERETAQKSIDDREYRHRTERRDHD